MYTSWKLYTNSTPIVSQLSESWQLCSYWIATLMYLITCSTVVLSIWKQPFIHPNVNGKCWVAFSMCLLERGVKMCAKLTTYSFLKSYRSFVTFLNGPLSHCLPLFFPWSFIVVPLFIIFGIEVKQGQFLVISGSCWTSYLYCIIRQLLQLLNLLKLLDYLIVRHLTDKAKYGMVGKRVY